MVTKFGWSDSKVVIAWLSSGSTEKWKPFVRNRVNAITETIPGNKWNYVKSEQNPADIVSRGCDYKTLMKSQLWFNGPEWLKREEEIDQTNKFELNIEEREVIQREERKEVRILVSQLIVDNWVTRFAQKYSNFSRSCRILGWIKRFINNCRNREKIIQKFITIAETINVQSLIVKQLQELYFEEELVALNGEKCVSRSSQLRHLNPFIDEVGCLRVGGRIQSSNLPFEQKHPLIIPAKGGLVTLIIEEAHRTWRCPSNAQLSSEKILDN